MKIGVLTYYRVANFGANLQAVSTYNYLERLGHEPIFIHYMSRQLYEETDRNYDSNQQIKANLDFIDKYIARQTEVCFSASDINFAIEKYEIEAIIVGSDAVLQHHPLLSRMYSVGNKFNREFIIEKVNDERLFPNLFWGIGLNKNIPLAMMSVSSQNSEYRYFTPWLKWKMRKALKRYSYISVRDIWTQKMLEKIMGKKVPLTPDPVFAFNENAGSIIPEREYILSKYKLPKNYILVSFLNVGIPTEVIYNLKEVFAQVGLICVAFPSQLGVRFQHNYDHEIQSPLNPSDWYALIKYSQGYIGNNMHPIIVSLHNAIPCFSIDNYSNYNFLRHPKNDNSSKIKDVLTRYGLGDNIMVPFKNNTDNLHTKIFNCIMNYPKESVMKKSEEQLGKYELMMKSILKSVLK